MKFAFGLYPYSDASFSQLLDLAVNAEELNFDGVFALDHVVKADISYTRAFLEPFTLLAAVASKTTRVKLGTDIVVLPIRPPVLTAKMAAMLNYMAPGRVIVGVASGYNPKEYQSCGIPIQQKTERMDECLDILVRLFKEQTLSYQGKFYSFEEISLDPYVTPSPKIWVAGGTALPRPFDDPSLKRAYKMRRRLLTRIIRSDGWISRATTIVENIKSDWEQIIQAAERSGRKATEITFAHMNWLHLSQASSRDGAYREQKALHEKFFGFTKPWDWSRECYLTGTVEDIREKIARLEEIGVEYIIVHPLKPDLAQLVRWKDEILSHFK